MGAVGDAPGAGGIAGAEGFMGGANADAPAGGPKLVCLCRTC